MDDKVFCPKCKQPLEFISESCGNVDGQTADLWECSKHKLSRVLDSYGFLVSWIVTDKKPGDDVLPRLTTGL